MIVCLENCKYQKNGECTYDAIQNKSTTSLNSICAYFEQE